jgi:hypothetical protein
MLLIEGECEAPGSFDLKALSDLPEQISDVSKLAPKREGGAVWLRVLLERARRRGSARFATLASGDGSFAISVPLAPLLERAFLVYRLGDAALPDNKGGPVRLLLTGDVPCESTEQLDACAQVKQLARIKLTNAREPDIGHEH